MRHIIELSIDKVFETAIIESGQFFRGVRSVANNAESASLIDSSIDDFVLTEDDKVGAMPHLKVFVSELYDTIRGYCPEYAIDGDDIAFVIEGAEDCNTTARVTPLVEMFFVYRILAWWYRYRNGDMANNYLLLADDYRQQVLSAIVPKFSTRKLRFI